MGYVALERFSLKWFQWPPIPIDACLVKRYLALREPPPRLGSLDALRSPPMGTLGSYASVQ
jgi:hypothetical protein